MKEYLVIAGNFGRPTTTNLVGYLHCLIDNGLIEENTIKRVGVANENDLEQLASEEPFGLGDSSLVESLKSKGFTKAFSLIKAEIKDHDGLNEIIPKIEERYFVKVWTHKTDS